MRAARSSAGLPDISPLVEGPERIWLSNTVFGVQPPLDLPSHHTLTGPLILTPEVSVASTISHWLDHNAASSQPIVVVSFHHPVAASSAAVMQAIVRVVYSLALFVGFSLLGGVYE